jgi:hypothetical protein
MDRHRTIAASPFRSSADAWNAIQELITNTLQVADDISLEEVKSALASAATVGRHLVAGGYLKKSPLVLCAGSTRLEIFTIDGDDAFCGGDDTKTVPGAAKARNWTLYLPKPEPLDKIVRKLTETNPHLSCEDPPRAPVEATASEPAIDREAIRRLKGDTV